MRSVSVFNLTALLLVLPVCGLAGSAPAASGVERQVLFGGLHVHTSWSLDTSQLALLTGPDDAYRFARGESITHVTGEQIRLASGPLDFLAVTDHSEYMALGRPLGTDASSPLNDLNYARLLQSDDAYTAVKARMGMVDSLSSNEPIAELLSPEARSYPWSKIIEIADRYNQPGRFTTFAGFEWTSAPGNINLHRVVLFGADNNLPPYPLTAFDTEDPAGLWDWLDELRSAGARTLAIPHNSNISDGRMFPAQAANAEQRMRNEPLVEIMQVKGASETHPALSPNDEWADFAINELLLGRGMATGDDRKKGRLNGSYMREAWLTGLRLQAEQGGNPYRFGVIASSDTHSTAGSYEEANYFGSKGVNDSTAELRLTLTNKPPAQSALKRPVRNTLAGSLRRNGAGLAGVWAEENTRAAIFAALERKETFGTSGPRIRVRVFGGWDFTAADASDDIAAIGYVNGVPMGGTLPERPANDVAPSFLLQTSMDPDSAPLQRVQIIKGWFANGATSEMVYDVLCAGGAQPDKASHRCPANKATVDLTDCSFKRSAGAARMAGTWRDPNFDPEQPAFYYVRVLENPTCRWSTWDAVRLDVPIPDGAAALIQERAWTSPIWYAAES